MCHNFGNSQSDLMIVHREIFKRFEQIRDFSTLHARDKRATDQSTP